MSIDVRLWKITQKRLGYTDDELETFKKDPRNEDILTRGPELMRKNIILEVVESHGCNSRQKVGD